MNPPYEVGYILYVLLLFFTVHVSCCYFWACTLLLTWKNRSTYRDSIPSYVTVGRILVVIFAPWGVRYWHCKANSCWSRHYPRVNVQSQYTLSCCCSIVYTWWRHMIWLLALWTTHQQWLRKQSVRHTTSVCIAL